MRWLTGLRRRGQHAKWRRPGPASATPGPVRNLIRLHYLDRDLRSRHYASHGELGCGHQLRVGWLCSPCGSSPRTRGSTSVEDRRPILRFASSSSKHRSGRREFGPARGTTTRCATTARSAHPAQCGAGAAGSHGRQDGSVPRPGACAAAIVCRSCSAHVAAGLRLVARIRNWPLGLCRRLWVGLGAGERSYSGRLRGALRVFVHAPLRLDLVRFAVG